ncbi:MAG: methyl-accepting chemotaxis protein [Ignavibacteria bacterium]|jgi:methyl-accepting chemotaxis protein
MKMKSFGNWNIFPKIMTLTFIILLSFFIYIQFGLLPSIENELVNEKKDQVAHTVETAYSTIKYYSDKAVSGEMLTEEAQEKAISEVKEFRFDGDNYFWINDMDVKMIMHPLKPEMDGTSVKNVKDPNGVYLFKESVDICRQNGSGFVEYSWEKPGTNKIVPKMSYVKLLDDWGWVIGSGIYIDDVEDQVSSFNSKVVTVVVIIAVGALLVGFFIAKQVSSRVTLLAESADKVANGNVDVHVDIKSENEVGKLANSFNKMVENIRLSMQEIKEKSEAAERAAADAEEAQQFAQEQSNYLAEKTRIMLDEMSKFADGDLSVSLEELEKDDDVARLFIGFNNAVKKIKEMILNVGEATRATASASSEISSSAEEMAAGSQEQSAQAAEVASAVEEMTKTIMSTANNASRAAESSKEANELAEKGNVKVEENRQGIERIMESAEYTAKIIASLAGKTDQIGEIAQVIDDIADQTNLLALNAAIEAARAGEQGRGFAVVADEVRKLAERTTKATKEIAETISAIQQEAKEADESMHKASGVVNEGMKLTREVGEALLSIKSKTEVVSDEINQVAAASEEQSTASEQISKNIEGINSVSHEAALSTQQIAKAAEDLNNLTLSLQNLISQFKVDQSYSTNMEHNSYIGDNGASDQYNRLV